VLPGLDELPLLNFFPFDDIVIQFSNGEMPLNSGDVMRFSMPLVAILVSTFSAASAWADKGGIPVVSQVFF